MIKPKLIKVKVKRHQPELLNLFNKLMAEALNTTPQNAAKLFTNRK